MEPMIDERALAQLTGAMGRWDQGSTCLAALALATEALATDAVANEAVTADAVGVGPLVAVAREVMAAAGLDDVLASVDRLPFSPAQLRGMAAAPLLQAATLASGPPAGWMDQSDSALTAQGEASGSAAALFTRFVLPLFDDLADRLSRPGARMLDVGTGIGALAVGFAGAFPQLYVTGIDVMPRVLQIARSRVGASPVASRVELRQQDVAELSEEQCYDLAWIPAPFVPEPALRAGVARVVAALRTGGLLMMGHGTFDGTDLEVAIARFKTIAYGGTPLDGPAAAKLLTEHGLSSVQTVTTPPGAPDVTVGRR